MALARADDPEKAAEEERTKARDGMAAHRKRVAATNVSRDSQPASPPKDYRLTEEDYAAQIVRDVEREIANLDGEVADLDLLRELILQKLTFAFKGGESTEQSAPAIESSPEPAPARRPGRPWGSKNKPKEAAAPTPEPARTGNDVDTDATAEARKAAAAAAEAAGPEPPSESTPDDGSIPGFLRRAPEAGAAA
jgi:hypothetical protein